MLAKRSFTSSPCLTSCCLLLAIALQTGCNQQAASEPAAAAPQGSVAVIDLDRVAQQLGQDKRISQTLTARQTTLQKQLAELAQNYRQQITQQQKTQQQNTQQQNTQQKQATAAETQDQGAIQLASFQQQANAKLNQARQQVTRDLASQRSQLIASFREQIKPYAREAARSRGLSVIVTNNDSVIYDYTASVDITDDVVKAIARRQKAN